MALQSGGNGPKNDTKLIILKPKSQDKDKNQLKPYFQVTEKVNDKWEVSANQTIDRFSGRLKKVVAKESEFKRGGVVVETKDIVQLYVEDGDETYLVEFTYRLATRRLFTRLANLKTFDNLEISYWRDDGGYDSFSLRQNGEIVQPKFAKEELPQPKEVTVNKVKMRDNSELDAFLKAELELINDKISAAAKTEVKSSVKTKVVDEVKEDDSDNTDDIPF